jgi:predicted ester cyclase
MAGKYCFQSFAFVEIYPTVSVYSSTLKHMNRLVEKSGHLLSHDNKARRCAMKKNPVSILYALTLFLLLAAQSTTVATQTLPVSSVSTISLDDEKKLSRRAIDWWASNNSDTTKDTFAANYINHQEPYAEGGTKALSLEAWEKLVSEYHGAFSNSMVRILMQIAEGNFVATQWQITATQTGNYVGHAPSGKTVTWTGVSIDRFEDGKIVESWVNWDKYSLFEGLGLLK